MPLLLPVSGSAVGMALSNAREIRKAREKYKPTVGDQSPVKQRLAKIPLRGPPPDVLAEHADETDAWWHEQRMAIAASPDAYPVGKAWEPERAGLDASREPKCVSDPAPVIEFRNCVMRYGHPDSPKSVTFRVLQLDSLS